MNWAKIYTEIEPLFFLYNSGLRNTIITITIIIALIGVIIYKIIERKKINFKLGFIHILPLLIFCYFLSKGLYQTWQLPRAFQGSITKKYQEGSHPYIVVLGSSLVKFNAAGIVSQKQISGKRVFKTTAELYSSLDTGKTMYLIVSGDDTALGAVIDSKLLAPLPYFLKEDK